jgi:HEPN domain
VNAPPTAAADADVWHYLVYVRQYVRASRLLDATGGDFFWPRCQLLGHALELALKGFLLAAGERVPRTHDLKALLTQARTAGLTPLDDKVPDDVIVGDLHDVYSELLAERWRFPARYPRRGIHSWKLPPTNSMLALIESVADKARTMNPGPR